MSDTIGRITVPSVVLSTGGTGISGTQVFPLTSQYGFGFSVERPIIVHRFGSLDAKQEQRYFAGVGPRKFQFRHANLNWSEGRQLKAFWESMQGPWKAFTYTVPNADRTTSSVLVTFEAAPLSLDNLQSCVSTGFNLVEVIQTATEGPYNISATCTRFPSTALSTALLSETQEIIPLIHIKVREVGVADIYLSDRRVTIGGQLYLPRLVGMGESGSDAIISQDIKGTSDTVRFTFGNADRAMTSLANDTDLKYASIDLCLYHVNSGILLQLWKGVIQSFTVDGTANFPVTCSDGFFQLMNQYPERRISRQCWKTFNDGVNCPYGTRGSGGDSSSCDYYLESANGCQAHGMSPWFGGQQCDPQGVNIKDDSTGFMGFGRNNVTATSIVSDSVWGLALPEIWCNSGGNALFAYVANALMVDYRDESGYSDSLGILGAGPLGGFSGSMVVTNADGFRYVVAPMVDGFLWQGLKIDGNLNVTKYQPGMGLRYLAGHDPAPNDPFSLGQGSPAYYQPNNYAAGTAAAEIRIVKSTTIQPSTPDQHQMTVPIDYGLWGWVWDADGNRSAVRGLINPFWIAVNMMLRAMGLYGDPPTGSNPAGGSGPASADQLATFVLPSLNSGDGSGAAEIAAAQVAAILGGGTETQFQFQGVISSQKPFRDWLTEVLNCCLGFYTWEFGKLKLGCRVNASAVDAYTIGNILFQSLKLTPIAAAFEHLVLSYADVAYQYQANTGEYCDKSHAAYYGRAGSPLTSQMHSVGCSTLSQALRIAATRTREEIGGVTPEEWKNARAATWQTTLLGLGNYAGQVVSMTHPDIPGGTMNFRIQRWTLKKDWSIQIEGQTVTPSMYDLDVGPKPIDVSPNPLPALFYPIPLAPMWAPHQIQAQSWDALFPSEWNFDSAQQYVEMADGSVQASQIATGVLPVTDYSATGAGSPAIGTVTQSDTGGSLPPNSTLRLALCAIDSNGQPSWPSKILIIGTSAGAGSVTLSDITWPSVAGLTSYALYASLQDDLICLQQASTLTPDGTGIAYSPQSITFAGPLQRSTYALPSPYVANVRVKAKVEVAPGLLCVPVDSVTTSQIVCSELISTPFTAAQLVSRVVSVVGRPIGNTPLLNLTITGYVPATGTLTVSPQAVVSGQAMQSVQAGDMVAIRFKGSDNTANEMQATDAAWTPAGVVSVGDVLRVIAGTGRGQLRKINALLSNGVQWDLPLHLDATSVWIVEKPTWQSPYDAPAIDNADYQHSVSLAIPVPNYVNKPVVIAGFTVDVYGVESPDGDNPIREDWIFGQASAGSGGDTLVPPSPLFTAEASVPGSIRISQVNFGGATTNLQSISTMQVGVYSEVFQKIHAGSQPDTLHASITDTDATVTLSTSGGADLSGQFIIFDSEVLFPTSLISQTPSGRLYLNTYQCSRGLRGSTAAAHTSGAHIVYTACATYFYNFVAGFWNPAHGTAWQTWEATELLPSTTIAWIDMVLTNSVGLSPLVTTNYLSAGGLITTDAASGSSSGLSFVYNGRIMIDHVLTAPYQFQSPATFSNVQILFNSGPTSAITVGITQNGTTVQTLNPVTSPFNASVSLSFAAGDYLTIDVTSVPIGSGTFPGSGMRVTLS